MRTFDALICRVCVNKRLIICHVTAAQPWLQRQVATIVAMVVANLFYRLLIVRVGAYFLDCVVAEALVRAERHIICTFCGCK